MMGRGWDIGTGSEEMEEKSVMLNVSSILPFSGRLLYWFSERYPFDFFVYSLVYHGLRARRGWGDSRMKYSGGTVMHKCCFTFFSLIWLILSMNHLEWLFLKCQSNFDTDFHF